MRYSRLVSSRVSADVLAVRRAEPHTVVDHMFPRTATRTIGTPATPVAGSGHARASRTDRATR
jgi:hypothetical protein